MRSPRPGLGWAPILAAALVVAACGGAADTGQPESTTQPDETTTTAAETTSTVEEHAEESEDHSQEAVAADADIEIEVVMSEFAFEPAAFEVKAGETVRFVISNEGVVPHEFRLSNSHRIEEHMAAGHDDHGEEDGHHDEGDDMLVEIEAGGTGELVMTFPEDTTLYTEVACLLPGHYEAGMTAPLTYSQS